MKTKLLFFFLLGWSIITHAQINVSESFETSFPSGWSTTGQSIAFSRTNNPPVVCDGSWAMQTTLYGSNNHAMIITPNYTSDGNPITVSFNYFRGVDPDFVGYAFLYYELNNSGAWVQFANSSIGSTQDCQTLKGYLAKGVIPNGSLVKFRMQLNGSNGGTIVSIDNFKAVQEVFYAEYTFDSTLYNTLGKYSFAAANTSFVNDRFGVANKALQIAANTTSTATIPGLPVSLNPRSVSVWYKTNSNSNFPAIFAYGANAANQKFGLYLGSNGNPIFQAYGNDKNFGGSYAANTWHHAVVTYDGSTIKMYMNGTLIGSQAYTLNTGNSVFSIGSNAASIVTIDDLKIYDIELSAVEVAALYAQEVLPVELSSFTAKLNNKTTTLLWSTATEVNTSHFDIEYSNNGSEFVKVGQVLAQGYSNAIKRYNYQHSTNNQAKHYYRLKMVDKDGRSEYSKTIALNLNLLTSFLLSPNPAKDLVQVSTGPIKSGAELSFVNTMGKTVKRIRLEQENPTISLKDLPKGLYVVKLKIDQHEQLQKLIKE